MQDKVTGVHRGKLEACLKGLQAQYAKLGEQLQSFEALLSEQPTPGQAARTWLVTFGTEWTRRYRERFIVASWPKDLAVAKRLLAQLGHNELTARAARYLADRDQFYVQAKHPLGLFATNINRYGGTPGADEEFLQPPPIGCTHRPQCQSDVTHTARVNRELRA